MNIKKVLALLLSLVLVLGAVACSKDSNEANVPQENNDQQQQTQEPKVKDGGSITFAVGSDPNALNPLYASDRVTMTINNALYNPLFVMNGENNRYYLAQDITVSEDSLTYTVKLKDNLKWHDGEKITADDLVFTMEQILDEKQNSFLRDLFIIDGVPVQVAKVDELTVEFKLPTVLSSFMGSLVQVLPIPKHVFEGEADIAKSEKNENPIGSGPFKFKEWNKGESIVLERFEDYYAGRPHLDNIVYRVIPDSNSAKVAFEGGEVSASYIEPKEFEKYKTDSNFNVFSYGEGMLDYMIFNQNIDVLKNRDVREAIALAIDKEELVNGSYESIEYADMANSILTPDALYYTDDVRHFEYDAAKSKELLSKSGYENGLKLKMAYMNSRPKQQNQALIIQQKLKEIGIELELIAMERGAYYQKLLNPENKDFDLAFNGYVMGPEPDSYKSIYMTGQIYNISQYSNKEVDGLWNKGAVETDKEKRKEIYTEVQKKVIDDIPVYPIAYPKSLIGVSKNIGGVEEARTVPIFMFEDLSKLYVIE